MIGKSEIQEQLDKFLSEGKHYVGLQKELIQLIIAEKLSLLLSMILTVIVFIILLSMILFFPLMGLAAWLGTITSPALGYLIVALLIFLISIVVYYNRHRLIEEPITRTITYILAPEKEDELKHHDKSDNYNDVNEQKESEE